MTTRVGNAVDFVHPDEGSPPPACDTCGSPYNVILFLKVSASGRRTLVSRMCDMCIGKALEISTGHAILNQLQQWNMMSVAASEMAVKSHISRRATKKRAERDAARERRRTQSFND